MTDKQKQILKAALQLFATDGYHATPTRKVAMEAGVSEGLLFRHFGNKEGLLEALLDVCEKEIQQTFSPVMDLTDPKEIIVAAVNIPFLVSKEDYPFFRLVYKLKWEVGYNSTTVMQPLAEKLQHAFHKLGIRDAAAQTEVLLIVIDGVGASLLKDQVTDKKALRRQILRNFLPAELFLMNKT